MIEMFGSKLNTVESLDQNKDTGSNLGETFICNVMNIENIYFRLSVSNIEF